MPIQYVGGQGASFAGVTAAQNITFALTSGLASTPAAGDLVVVAYTIASTADRQPQIRTTGGVDYTLLGTELYADDSFDTNLRVAYRFMPSTPDTQVRLTEAVGGGTGNVQDAGNYHIWVVRGVDPQAVIDVAVATATGINTRLPNPPSITPVTPGAIILVVGAGAGGTGGVYTTSGLTDFRARNQADTNDALLGAGYLFWTSGAYDHAVFTGGGTDTVNDSWASVVIALRPAPEPEAADALALTIAANGPVDGRPAAMLLVLADTEALVPPDAAPPPPGDPPPPDETAELWTLVGVFYAQVALADAAAQAGALGAIQAGEVLPVSPVVASATLTGTATLTASLAASSHVPEAWLDELLIWQIPPPPFDFASVLLALADSESLPVDGFVAPPAGDAPPPEDDALGLLFAPSPPDPAPAALLLGQDNAALPVSGWTNSAFPLRGAFYYGWFTGGSDPNFPGAWDQVGIKPFAQHQPKLHTTGPLAFYDSGAATTIDNHIAALTYGGFDFAILSWWGVGSREDLLVDDFLARLVALGSNLKVTVYYEAEGNTVAGVTGSPDPTPAQIASDLNYLSANYSGHQNWLHIGGKPVVFAYGGPEDGTQAAADRPTKRWADALATPTNEQWYDVLKVYGGYLGEPDQPSSWHQYGPAAAFDQQGSLSVTVSPGYWYATSASPLLERDKIRFAQDVTRMIRLGPDWQLITSFNEFGEGHPVENVDGNTGRNYSGPGWDSASGYGEFLDILAWDGQGWHTVPEGEQEQLPLLIAVRPPDLTPLLLIQSDNEAIPVEGAVAAPGDAPPPDDTDDMWLAVLGRALADGGAAVDALAAAHAAIQSGEVLPVTPVVASATISGAATLTAALAASSVVPEDDSGLLALIPAWPVDAAPVLLALSDSEAIPVEGAAPAPGDPPPPEDDSWSVALYDTAPPDWTAAALIVLADTEAIPVDGGVVVVPEPVLEDDALALLGAPPAVVTVLVDPEMLPVGALPFAATIAGSAALTASLAASSLVLDDTPAALLPFLLWRPLADVGALLVAITAGEMLPALPPATVLVVVRASLDGDRVLGNSLGGSRAASVGLDGDRAFALVLDGDRVTTMGLDGVRAVGGSLGG